MAEIWGAAIAAGGSIAGAYISSQASGKAAGQQVQGLNNAISGLNQQNQLNNQLEAPYRLAGQNGLAGLQEGFGYDVNGTGADSLAGIGLGQFTHQFDANDLNSNLAPNYAFQLAQGQGATSNLANASGGLLSGNALKAIQDYTQGAAGSAYQQAFENYNTNQNNIYSRLMGMAGIGANATDQTATLGTNLMGDVASATAGIGASQAAGTVGSANALSSGLNNAALYGYLGANKSNTTGTNTNTDTSGGIDFNAANNAATGYTNNLGLFLNN